MRQKATKHKCFCAGEPYYHVSIHIEIMFDVTGDAYVIINMRVQEMAGSRFSEARGI